MNETPLAHALVSISEIAEIQDIDLFTEERHMLALHDDRNRLLAENAALQNKLEHLKNLNTQIAEISLRNAQERDDANVENAALRRQAAMREHNMKEAAP